MNAGSKQNENKPSDGLPDWADCDLFCIRDYAGTGAASCGWRGRTEEARRHPFIRALACPRCGNATLLRIPLDRADKSGT